MAVENDFLPFAVGGSANVLTQAQYAALTSLLQNGFQSGIANSQQLNKVWRQSSIMAAVIASFIVAETGQTAIDDGTTATLLANFTAAVNAASKSKVVLTDTGAANAYAASNPVPLTTLPTATGFTQTVKIAHTNTGTSTYAPDGLATAPIYGLGGSLLQGGEMPANGIATLVSFVDPLLNSGNLCWVLYECAGGAQQTAPATASQHAMQLGQATGRLLRVTRFSSSTTFTPGTGTTQIVVKIRGGGGGSASAPATGSAQVSVGGPGSQGAYAESLITSGFSGQTITVGAGGSAGASGGSGGRGGTSTFMTVSATGGYGGSPGGPSSTSAVAGAQSIASASGGTISNVNGGGGGYSFAVAATGAQFGAGGVGGGDTQPTAAGNIPGSGGGGVTQTIASSAAVPGAAGAAGFVEIWEYA